MSTNHSDNNSCTSQTQNNKNDKNKSTKLTSKQLLEQQQNNVDNIHKLQDELNNTLNTNKLMQQLEHANAIAQQQYDALKSLQQNNKQYNNTMDELYSKYNSRLNEIQHITELINKQMNGEVINDNNNKHNNTDTTTTSTLNNVIKVILPVAILSYGIYRTYNAMQKHTNR